jgi:ribose/xylose/arabinose/galactoside ABC-type transport system permease subunit
LAIIMNKAVTNALGNESVKLNIQDEAFRILAIEWWVPVLIFVVLSVFLFVVLNYTILGRHIYAMGGNEQAAKLSGIRTERLKWFAYCFGAFTAGLAGMLMASDTSASDPESNGMMFELFAIAAAVIGGCSLAGGVGRVSGIVLGAIFLRVVIDAVEKLITGGGASNYQGLIVGVLVVLAVAFNEITSSVAGWRKQFFPGALGIVALISIGILVGAVLAFSLQLSDNPRSWTIGLITGMVTAIVLGVIRVLSYLLGRFGSSESRSSN